MTSVVGFLNDKVNYNSDVFGNIPLFYLGAILGCTGLVFFSIALHKQKVLEWIGKHTLPILLMHKFPVLLFQILPPFKGWLQNPDSIIGILSGVFISFLVILLCLLVYSFLHLIFPILFGEKR